MSCCFCGVKLKETQRADAEPERRFDNDDDDAASESSSAVFFSVDENSDTSLEDVIRGDIEGYDSDASSGIDEIELNIAELVIN